MNNEMNNITNCITVIKGIISNSCLNISCDDIPIYVREEIDTDKFKTWFDYNLDKFKDKSNQNQYFKKSFANELSKGTFTLNKVYYVPATEPMVNELRSKGIVLLADDTAYLYTMWEELLNHYKVPRDVCVQINRYAINNLIITSDFNHYKKLVKESALLVNYKVDWAAINKKTSDFIAKWNETLDELESSYE